MVGCGTVFSVTRSGKEKVLHNFGTGSDGGFPSASLLEVNGTLYGTTQDGGKYHSNGTVFSITLGGVEKVLHNFGKGADGADPAAPLIESKGKLYGTTYVGPCSPSCRQGNGTVFSITTGGTEKVLHSFTYADGTTPAAALVDVNATLYGTTSFGGAYGWGTVFALKP